MGVVGLAVTTLGQDDVRDFLMTGTRTGKLAWVGTSGKPLVVPIWFVLDGDTIVFNTDEGSGKAKALRADGRVSLVVDLEEPPYGFVRVDGRAELSDDPAEVHRTATRIGGRYMGADRAAEFGDRNGVPGELVVRIRPDKVTAAFAISD